VPAEALEFGRVLASVHAGGERAAFETVAAKVASTVSHARSAVGNVRVVTDSGVTLAPYLRANAWVSSRSLVRAIARPA